MDVTQVGEEEGTGLLGSVNKKLVVGGLIIAVALGYLMLTSFQSTMAYYLTVDELKAKGDAVYGERVRLGGRVAAGSIQRDTSTMVLRFSVSQGEESLPVVYRGIVPDIFGEEIDVVVEGRYIPEGVLQANTLLAKCPSKMVAALDASNASRDARGGASK